MKKTWLLILIICFCAIPLKAQWVDLKVQVQFLPNILAFDRNQLRYGNPVSVGVSSDEALKVFEQIVDQADVNGKKLSFTKLKSSDDVTNYKVVYIDDNMSKDIDKIVEHGKANQILIICKKDELLEKGAGVSFRKVLNKPQIVVNQENCKSQGSNFIANFLKAVIVI